MKRFLFGLLLVAALIYGVNAYNQAQGKASLINLDSINSLTAKIPGQALALAQSKSSSSSAGVQGKPTISADFIDKVLAAYHSPAQGTGAALYQDGVNYGIDPAYALAFFMHESLFATTGVARATLSLGNIRCSEGYQCIEGYRAYQSYQAGYDDWYKLIKMLYIDQWHLSTIEQIIPVYAPTSDGNNVPGYIQAVNSAVQAWRAGKVKV